MDTHVSSADADVVEVRATDVETIGTLTELGFEPHADQGGLPVLTVDDDEKAEVFAALRDAGVCFSRGRGWNSVEVYQWLCEEEPEGPVPDDRVDSPGRVPHPGHGLTALLHLLLRATAMIS